MSTALYRRYRPDTFADMIGQEHVTAPLMQALRSNRVNHAYLFSGPRGCGKTTSARVLARILNCARNTEEDPRDTPCGQCASCQELARGGSGSLDVVEIDAASHGGVDDARELRERATFSPSRDRFKIFILDEAHMVTAQGFNALLKIVEEPPPYLKFIFATTEPDKVIGTIRSRTHHYPFKLVAPETMLSYLSQLCSAEGIAAGEGVLPLVVRAGGGSVRDTLSVLDQLIAGAEGGAINYDSAVALLGYTPASLLDDVVDALAAHDGAHLFRVVEEVINTGHEPRRFVEDVLERLRDLIIMALSPDGARAVLPSVPVDQFDRMSAQAQTLGAAQLTFAADTVNSALSEMSGATSPRLHLELLCARLLLPAAQTTGAAFGARLERVEHTLASGGGVRAHSGDSAAPDSHRQEDHPQSSPATAQASDHTGATSRPVKRPESTRTPRPAADQDQPQAQAQPQTRSAQVPAEQVVAAKPEPQPVQTQSSPSSSEQTSEDVALAAAASWAAAAAFTAQETAPAPGPPQNAPAAPVPDSRDNREVRSEHTAPQPPTTQPVAPQPAPQTVTSAPAAPQSGVQPDQVRAAWPQVLETLRGQSMPAWALANQHATISGITADTVMLSFPSPGLVQNFVGRGADAMVADAFQHALGTPVRVSAHVAGQEPTPAAPPLLAAPDMPMHRPASTPASAPTSAPAHDHTAPTGWADPEFPAEPPMDAGEPDFPDTTEHTAPVEQSPVTTPSQASPASPVPAPAPPATEASPLPVNMFGAAAAAFTSAHNAALPDTVGQVAAKVVRDVPRTRGESIRTAASAPAAERADTVTPSADSISPTSLSGGSGASTGQNNTPDARDSNAPASTVQSVGGAGEAAAPSAVDEANVPPWEETPRQAAERRAREQDVRDAAQQQRRAVLDYDEPQPDDEDLEASALFGVPLLMKRLGAVVIDEIVDTGR